jgi:cytochrome c-type biogenesis protein CcmH/NrfG/DNA-directed RNA polymerase subunit RPC12/RpoP
MNPKILCSKCSAEIRLGDKFCASCGAIIDWNAAPKAGVSGQDAVETKSHPAGATPIQCPLCGHQNESGNTHCASCGAALQGVRKPQSRSRTANTESSSAKPSPLTKFQSWKVTLGAAVILIIVVVALKMTRGGDEAKTQAALPNDAHQNQALMSELESLEKAVQENPGDAATMLHLANRLQDAKFLPKAVETYRKYLAIKPDDANATVDLGVTYYEMSMTDTIQREEDLQLAQNQFQAALKLNPKHQLALFNLGVVGLMHGDMATAKDWFKKTIAIDSTSETGRRAVTLIQQHGMINN